MELVIKMQKHKYDNSKMDSSDCDFSEAKEFKTVISNKERELEEYLNKINIKEKEILKLEREKNILTKELTKIQRSTSWKITLPFRKFSTLVKILIGKKKNPYFIYKSNGRFFSNNIFKEL